VITKVAKHNKPSKRLAKLITKKDLFLIIEYQISELI